MRVSSIQKIENNIKIRNAEDGDVKLIASWLDDEQICKYLSSSLRDRPIPPQLITVTLKRQDQSWVIVLVDEKPTGLLVLDDFDAGDGIANLWYLLGDLRMRGKHIMPTAIKLLTDAPPLPVQVISAWVGSNNEPSLRCIQRASFRFVGRIKNAFRVDGLHDRMIFEKQISLNDE